ncbi:MAG: ArsR family transcriptional regulator [Candidatus Thermoplasmatota archaeon]|nr:ArsR family transcriptional regulator [Euryarchaeota archaeon]MBU4032812.1 ArsR family transcriptional regulator [Candidatus Thermoplasmatota archaeon]MBU4071537.1 ArsR family transcriptional regulator [Candidatus Thermoplasmatota archaeon]MBU4144503.1 ArsR family transcriptional regulator [Candidatus Thermoplasmatota archaeon]MBU4592703.1 ArsR family transcriptional regulator [Candidatus Thermoplasmatota archaeon]
MSAKTSLTKKDESIIDHLVAAGIPKNMAKTLAVLSDGDEIISVRIEGITALRQPEVSIVMQDLRDRKWVRKRDLKKEGKGRPVHAYKLAMPFTKIVEIIEKDERRKIKDIEANIAALKKLVK